MTQKFNWLFGRRKRSGMWFLIVFGMVSLMLAPISKMDSIRSNPDSKSLTPLATQTTSTLEQSADGHHRGSLVANASASLECVSRSAQILSNTGNSRSYMTPPNTLSADGRFVAFQSYATNLIPGQVDSNNTLDVFLYDRDLGTIELISRLPGTTTTTANSLSYYPSISADGQFVAFMSYASNLVTGQIDTNGEPDVFLYDRLAGTTELMSRASGTTTTTGNDYSGEVRISANGNFVAFVSAASNLIPGQTDLNGPESVDIFVYDRVLKTTELVTRAVGTISTTGNRNSYNPLISANGQWIVFGSAATNFVAGQINNNIPDGSDVYVFDRVTGIIQLVSRAAGTTTTTGNNSCGHFTISSNGQWIAFDSAANNLVTGQVIPLSTTHNVFLFNQLTGTTQLVSRAAGTTLVSPTSDSYRAQISSDGRYISYLSLATNLVTSQTDTNGVTGVDLFVFDRVTGTTQLVSRASGTSTVTANNSTEHHVISADGQLIAYQSWATNLVTGQADANGQTDIFVFDRSTGETLLLSGQGGSLTTTSNNSSTFPIISVNGRSIGFTSESSNLTSEDFNATSDVFLARVNRTVTASVTGQAIICTNQSATFTATVVGGTPPYTLTLTNGGGTQTGTSPLTFTVSPSSTTTYAIQSGTDANGNPITGSGSATVTVTSCPEQSSVLVADTTNNRIQRFDGTTWSVVGPGTVGSGNGQFRVPEAVAFNTSGRIYVADTGNNRIQWSTNGGTTWATFAASGTGLNQVSGPRGLALDSIGNLYVADGGNGRVVRFNNGVPGNAVILATKGTTAGRVQTPNGLAIDISFNLFIADTGNNRIQKITSAHTKTTPNTGTQIAGLGSGLTAVRLPQGVAVDSSGNLYVADTGNNRITRFTGGNPGTATLLAGAGAALGQVRAPEGVTLSAFSSGPLVGGVSLVVSDTTNNRIQGRNLNGTTWILVGSPNGLGTSPGQFRAPSKLR